MILKQTEKERNLHLCDNFHYASGKVPYAPKAQVSVNMTVRTHTLATYKAQLVHTTQKIQTPSMDPSLLKGTNNTEQMDTK